VSASVNTRDIRVQSTVNTPRGDDVPKKICASVWVRVGVCGRSSFIFAHNIVTSEKMRVAGVSGSDETKTLDNCI